MSASGIILPYPKSTVSDDTPDFTGPGFVVARSGRTWDAMIPAKDETDAQRLAADMKAQYGDQLTYCEIVPWKQ